MYDGKGEFVVKTLEELLPMGFGPEDLGASQGAIDGGGVSERGR